MYNVLFQCPFTMICSGSSQCGKTTFIFNLIQSRKVLFSKMPAKTIMFYKKHQDIYNQMLSNKLVDELVEVDEKMVSEEDFTKKVAPYKEKGGTLCVFDDLMEYIDATNSKIFTKIAHHENCSVIFLTQSLFVDNKHYRVMSRNANYIVVMKNPRDVSQIKNLSMQMGAEKDLLMGAYKEATKKAYTYLLIDFYPTTPEHIRLRSNIFQSEGPTKIYLHKNSI